MSLLVRRGLAAAAILLATACADRPSPLEPGDSGSPTLPSTPSVSARQPDQARNERLARRLALALRDAEFRAQVYQTLARSPLREGKVHFQGFLDGRGGARHRLAELASEPEAALTTDLADAPPIEIYLPVPSHRRLWTGGTNVLVATAAGDQDVPVAFDLWGRRHLLDPSRPPQSPVIALGRAELSFARALPTADACFDCIADPGDPGNSGGNPGGSPGSAAYVTPGLYLTHTQFNSKFEGWLKGAPEFEVHILGQDGTTSAMKSYQCAGENAGVPYFFNQDALTWNGSVLLFSQGQLDAYKAQHPGQAIRVFVVEDDDTPCVIKTDSASASNLFKQLQAAYGVFTAGKDTTQTALRLFKKASTLLSLLKSVWSFFMTPDDIVGNAIEDVVAGEYYPGSNWIVKGANGVTNGALRLEMH